MRLCGISATSAVVVDVRVQSREVCPLITWLAQLSRCHIKNKTWFDLFEFIIIFIVHPLLPTVCAFLGCVLQYRFHLLSC